MSAHDKQSGIRPDTLLCDGEQSRDEFGNDRGSHGATDNFQVTAVLITDSEGYEDSEGQGLREVPGTIVFDNTLGLHRVQYIADGTWSGPRLACM